MKHEYDLEKEKGRLLTFSTKIGKLRKLEPTSYAIEPVLDMVQSAVTVILDSAYDLKDYQKIKTAILGTGSEGDKAFNDLVVKRWQEDKDEKTKLEKEFSLTKDHDERIRLKVNIDDRLTKMHIGKEAMKLRGLYGGSELSMKTVYDEYCPSRDPAARAEFGIVVSNLTRISLEEAEKGLKKGMSAKK